MKLFATAAGLACALWAATPAFAERMEFDVSVAGINAGVLGLQVEESNGRYEARGSARSNRFISAIVDLRVDAVSVGQVDGNTYRPDSYTAESREDGEKSTRRIRYSGGRPEASETPTRAKRNKYAVGPQNQVGSLDPMTVLFALLRDRPSNLACDLDIQLYDGARSSQIVMKKARRDGSAIDCTGTYTRLEGYSPKDMKERRSWNVTMRYEAGSGGLMEVDDLRFSTDLGSIRLRRR